MPRRTARKAAVFHGGGWHRAKDPFPALTPGMRALLADAARAMLLQIGGRWRPATTPGSAGHATAVVNVCETRGWIRRIAAADGYASADAIQITEAGRRLAARLALARAEGRAR